MRYAVQKVPFISMSFGRPFGNARQLLNSNTRNNTRENSFIQHSQEYLNISYSFF
jgi:hypothetical protein